MIVKKYLSFVCICLLIAVANGCRTPANSDVKVSESDSSDELVAQRNKALEKELARVKQTSSAREDSRKKNRDTLELPVDKGNLSTTGQNTEKRQWCIFPWSFEKEHSSEPETTKQTTLKQGNAAVTNDPPSGKTRWWWPWGVHSEDNEVVKKPESPEKTKAVEIRDKATLTASDSKDSSEKIKVSHMFDRDARGSFFRRKESVPVKSWRWFGWFRKGESPSTDPSVRVINKTEAADEPVKDKALPQKPKEVTAVRKTPEAAVTPDRDQTQVSKQTDSGERTWRWFGWLRRSPSSSIEPSAKADGRIEQISEKDKEPLKKPVKKNVVRKVPEIHQIEPDPNSVEVAGPTNMIDDIRSGEIAKEPLLKAGFMLKIVVLASGKKEVDESEKRVAPSGTITLPLVGTVPVDGLTIRQLSDKLKELYSVYLRDPMVDVDFVIKTDTAGSVSPWGYVSVMGRVKKPGRINIPPTRDLTLSMAIQLAEGLDSSAKLTGIKITREIAGKAEQFEVNLQSVGDKGELGSDIKLRPGDVVYVPERVF